jgi:hypothetical protein
MRVLSLISAAFALGGCDDGGFDFERMLDQPKLEAYEASSAFADGMAMRRPPEGTIPREAVVGPPELVDGSREGV